MSSIRGHPHGSCKHIFLKPGLRVEKSQNIALARVDSESAYSAHWWRHHPTPRPLAFHLLTPQCLLTTTTMADYLLVSMLQKIMSLSGLLGQNIMLLCHYAEQKRIMDNRLAIFIFFLLCSVSPSTVCLYTVRKFYAQASSLLLCFWWISSATYIPEIWTKARWVIYNGSVWMQIFQYAKGDGGNNCFDTCAHGLKCSSTKWSYCSCYMSSLDCFHFLI